MYSLVLLTAMAAPAPETSSFLFDPPLLAFRGSSSCCGCCSGYRVGWHLGCSGSCSGCYGSCYGCHGSCTGCYGSCTGCYGSCTGCYGSCTGCYGSSSGVVMPYVTTATWGANYTYTHSYPGMLPTNVPGSLKENLPPPRKIEKMPEAAASLLVEIPADAKLYIDGQLMNGDAGTRHFTTPPLAKGEKFFYDVRVEVMKDGKPIAESQKVIVKAGDSNVPVSFMNVGLSTPVVTTK